MLSSDRLEALSRVSGRIAHDVSNYLYVVASAAEVLGRASQLDPRSRMVIDMLKRNTAETTELLERLLAFGACRPLRPERTELPALAASLEPRLHETLGPAIALALSLDAGCWPVHVDRGALEAALLELAKNAREAMPQGGRFSLRAANAGDEVLISAADTGTGMAAEAKARAFEPFFTTKAAARGEGWGLAQVYGFVRQCKGRIELESEAGRGTRVAIFLPRLTAADERSPARLAGLRVLLVEDEALIGMLTEDLLEELGCTVVRRASQVAEAVEAARAGDFNIALLDVNLHGESAYAVAEALEERGVPFLFVSAYGDLESRWRSRPMVQKPLEVGRLRREMERALGAAR